MQHDQVWSEGVGHPYGSTCFGEGRSDTSGVGRCRAVRRPSLLASAGLKACRAPLSRPGFLLATVTAPCRDAAGTLD